MKLSFSTLGCPDWSYGQILNNAKQMGFSAISIRGIRRKLNIDEIPEFAIENREDTLEKAEAAGVKLLCIYTPCSFHDINGFNSSVDEGKRSIDVAKDMKIPFLRVFGDTIESNKTEKETLERIARGIKILCDYANESDVKILLEVHGDCNTSERIKEIIRLVDSEHFGLIWDVEHSDRHYGDDFYAFYEEIKPYICHVHIKDYLREGTKVTLLGDGNVPLKSIISALEADGYDGYYEFEWEKLWRTDICEPEIAFPHFCSWMKTNFPNKF